MAKRIAVIDSETDPFVYNRVPAPFIWGFFDGDYYREFYTVEALVEFLEPQNIIVYAHNGGKFDYHFMLHLLMPFEQLTIISGRLAKFKIGCCEFRDSLNILPISLDKYKKDEIDYGIFEAGEREKPENKRAISDYLRSDCVYLFDLVRSFRNEYGDSLTVAGAAMKYWSKMSPKEVPKSTPEYYKFFTPYYYGGRVEVFESGIIDHHFELVDINSAYPRAMLDDHPYGLDYISITDKKALLEHDIVGHGFYIIESISFGAFPYREDTSALSFPSDGNFRRFHVTGWELLAALDVRPGIDIDIKSAIIHTSLMSFSEYVEHFYERRQVAKNVLKTDPTNDRAIKDDIYSKLFMNALYGKWAANPKNYKKFITVPQDAVGCVFDDATRGQDTELDNYKFGGVLGPWGLGVGELGEDEEVYYNLATAASITGWVRAFMFRQLSRADGLIYCDTDSIAARDIGKIDLGAALGQWEHEGNFKGGAVAGKKMYAFERETGGFKIASKGVRLGEREIYAIAEGHEISHIPQAPTFSVNRPPSFPIRRIKST